MADSRLEKLDQSSRKANDDSSARTIEYLRVRLLAERSVSKSARQRANELERRVEDLEEQLRIISLQRKMAEKATEDVLSILESRGMGDTLEAVDSDSDQETNRESMGGNGESTEGNGSIVSKRLIDSSSDHDCSPVGHRSLSWKGRCDFERSLEKDRNQSLRKHRVSSIGSSSSKQQLGKSCRQIRRREARMAVERKAEQAKLDVKENGDSSQPNGITNHSDSTAETGREGTESVGNERNITICHDVNGDVPVKDIKEALKGQARLIDRYEEMEEAQRKWEEKFSENNNITLDSYDPGIQSDVTEEQELKAQIPSNIGTDISYTEEGKADQVTVVTEPPKPQSKGLVPTRQVSNGDSPNQTSKGLNPIASDLPTSKKNKSPEIPESHNPRPPQNSSHNPHFNQSSSIHSFERPSSETGSSSQRGSQNDLYALVPHNPENSLESVLDALKKAKSQLNLKMTRPPPHGILATTSVCSASSAEMPVGCAGLFRLPTDFAVNEAENRPNFTENASSLMSSHFDPYLEIRTAQSSYRPQPSHPYPSDIGSARTLPSNGAHPFRVPEEDRMQFYSDNGRPNNNSMYR